MKASTPSSNKPASAARRVALTGLLAALALIFTYVEVLVPFNAGIPGIKLGLANLVPLIVLYRLDARYAAGVNLIRVVLAGLLFTGAFAMLYSLAGCIVSFLVMWACKKSDLFSVIGVSMAGGVFHNLGQLMVAMFAVSGLQLIHYMPVLILSGIIAGIIVGIGAYILLDRLPGQLFRG
ncbi:MAG: Gx transporter family protein [Lachnospiraceae bacterium]|nr:Gx transporter family protein [Lachnospiraceae bacterium]